MGKKIKLWKHVFWKSCHVTSVCVFAPLSMLQLAYRWFKMDQYFGHGPRNA